MKSFFIISVLFTLLADPTFCLAQKSMTDSTLQLKEVQIISSRLSDFSSGTKINTIDSLSLSQHSNQNLSNLLMDESSLFIKTYGQGSLATSAFRGGSANHTALLWNGFNINSPMNGQLDLSLIPVNFLDAVAVQYGGSSALWGSGAIGGSIHLNNIAKFNTGITSRINLGAGSFGMYDQQASIKISKRKHISSIKLFNTTAKNNFPFINEFTSDNVTTIQKNAELKSTGLLSENYFQIKENQRVNLFFWYQHTDRNIPPTMLQLINKSNQTDNNYRVTSEWKREGKEMDSYVRAAYFSEAMSYSDEIYQTLNNNHSQTVITEAEIKVHLETHHFLNIGINNTYATAKTSGYSNGIEQNRTALFASYRYTGKQKKLNVTVAARQELVKQQLIPFTYSAGADYQLLKWIALKSLISKVYRIPTFNDLYWNPGGNPNLLPESGYSEEIGLKINKQLNTTPFIFTTEPTVFNRTVENWIIWLPGANYWSPQNIMNVWSRGVETNSTLSIKVHKAKISISLLSNYVVSTNEKAKTANDASIDKQLIYVPMYSGHAKVSIEYKKIAFSYRHNYTGYRYTSTDNTQYLSPFYLGALYVSYKKTFTNSTANFFIQMNNIWNEQYQLVLTRAMPLRNWNAGISFKINKPNNNN